MRLKWHRGAWYAVWSEGGQTKRRSLRTKDRGEAERVFRDFQRRPSGETVSAIYEAYQTDKAGISSHERIVMAGKALLPFFGHYRPDQIDRALCREYTTKRRARVQDGTIRKELSTLRAALRYTDKNTPAVIEMPSNPQPREVWMTKDECDRLAEAAESPHVRLFILVARYTAARKEAILGLRWDAVDLSQGRISFGQGHGNKGRAVTPISNALKHHLVRAYDVRTSEYVIEWGGDRVKSIRKGFDSAKRKAGLDHITPHDLRRSAARWMVEAGVSMEEVSQYLGHTSTAVTRSTYARFSPEYLRKAAEALE